MLVLLAGNGPRLLAADKSAADATDQASAYSTGKGGSQLKWLGRPSLPAIPGGAVKQDLKAEEAKRRAKSDAAVKPTSYDVANDAPAEPSCDVRSTQDLQPSTETWSKSLREKKDSPAPGSAERLDQMSPMPEPKPARRRPSRLEMELHPQHHVIDQICPSPKDLKRIIEVTTDIEPKPPLRPADWPENPRALPKNCPLGNEVFLPRQFESITFTWTASALCHKPLYFEDVQLERYGHMAGPWLQPFASAANFFCTFPILPYKMGLELPGECVYTLGYYRPGDCAPYLFDPLPISVRGLFFESCAWVGGVAMFP
jgi:hypothetical protein